MHSCFFSVFTSLDMTGVTLTGHTWLNQYGSTWAKRLGYCSATTLSTCCFGFKAAGLLKKDCASITVLQMGYAYKYSMANT